MRTVHLCVPMGSEDVTCCLESLCCVRKVLELAPDEGILTTKQFITGSAACLHLGSTTRGSDIRHAESKRGEETEGVLFMGKLRTADIIGDPSTRSILVEIDRVGNLALEDHGAILIGWTFVNLPLNHMNRC